MIVNRKMCCSLSFRRMCVSNKTKIRYSFLRALRFEHDPQALPRQLTQPRHPHGTRELLLSAAPFPT